MSALLNLPWELREQIWIQALRRDNPLRRRRFDVIYQLNKPVVRKEEPIRDNVASLLCTCRQVEKETASIFYGMNDIVPYTSVYVDTTDYKDHHGFFRHVPTWEEWSIKSDDEKYDQLGISGRYIKHIFSLVIYNDVAKGISGNRLRYEHRSASLRGSKLLAEMLFWFRARAPQIQQLSIRYRDSRSRALESLTKGWIVSLSVAEQRLYQAVRRFPNLRLLDIRRVYARPGESHNWGDTAPLYGLNDHDPRLKGLKGQVLGSALRRATTSRWSETVYSVKCGTRWLLILDPRTVIPSQYHLQNSYIAGKIPSLSTPLEPAWTWSLHTVETWGRAQEIINSEILLGNLSLIFELRTRPYRATRLEKEMYKVQPEASASSWHRIWSMPTEIRTRIWKLILKRTLPLHSCVEGEGDPCIGALLKVDKRTYQECCRLFIKVNTFSMLPSVKPNPFTSFIVRDENFRTAMQLACRDDFHSLQLPHMDYIDALRSIHIDMWSSGYGTHSRRDYTKYHQIFRLLHSTAPLLSDLSIAHYSEDFESLPVPPSLWHRDVFQFVHKFRHLKLVTILFALEDTLYVDVPWMQRLKEVDWCSAPRLYEQNNSDRKGGWFYTEEELLNGFVWADEAMEIANMFHGRLDRVQAHTWDSTWAKPRFEGCAWRMRILPRCKVTVEEHECLPTSLESLSNKR